jgi:lysozyme
VLIFGVGYHYSNGLAYYFSFKSNKVLQQEEDKRISDVRNHQVLETIMQEKRSMFLNTRENQLG